MAKFKEIETQPARPIKNAAALSAAVQKRLQAHDEVVRKTENNKAEAEE